MTAFRAFGRGWADAWRSKIALVLMWFTYALIAKLVAVPALVWLLAPLAHSRMADKLLARFDPGWFGELGESVNTVTGAFSAAGVLAAALTWLVAVLFAGGVLTMLHEHWERFSFADFLAASGRHFGRILRLSLLGLCCYGLTWLVGHLPSLIAGKLYGEGMEAWPLGVAGIASTALTLLLWGWIATILDYAKVRLVSDDVRGAFKALSRAFSFVLRHIPQTMGVWLLNAILFAVLGAAYLLVTKAFTASEAATILLLIVIQQAFILFRTAQRVAGWGAALEIYAKLKPIEPALHEAVDEPEVVPEPPEWEGFGI